MQITVNARFFFFGSLALFVLIASGGAYPQVGRVEVFYLAVLVFSVASILFAQRTLITKEAFVSWSVLTGLFVILLAIRGDWLSNGMQNRVLVKLIMVLLVVMAFSTMSQREAIGIYIRVFNFLLKLSIVCLGIAYFDHNLFSPVAFSGKYSNINTVYLYNVDLTVKTFFGIHFIKAADIPGGIFRNQGIFWEPGVLSFFITWFYVLKNCYLKDKKLNGLYCFVEATTLSAAGIMIFMLAVIYVHFLHGKSMRSMRDLFVMIAVFLIIIFLFVVNENGIQALLRVWGGIFGRDFYNEASAITRWRDFYYGMMSAMDAPLWGHGWDYTYYSDVLRQEANFRKVTEWGGISNSIVAVFYRHGIFFWLLYMALLWRWSIRLSDGSPWGFFLFLVFAATLMHEPLDSSIIVMSFLVYPVMKNDPSMQHEFSYQAK